MKYKAEDIVILNPGLPNELFSYGLGEMENHRKQEGTVRRIITEDDGYGERILVDFPSCIGFSAREAELMFADTGDHFKIDNSVIEL